MEFKNTIITKQLVISYLESTISELPFSTDKKKYIRENVNIDDVYVLFQNIKTPNQVSDFTMINSDFQSMDDYVDFITSRIKIGIATAYTQAGIASGIIDENMTADEQMNLLIDLKNVEQITLLQTLVAQFLENKI